MTPQDLWGTLENLSEDQFQGFKWFLKQDDVPEGFSAISAARLEKASRQDTVDLMVQKYVSGALEVAMSILEKISRNDLKQRLFNTVSARGKDLNRKSELGETKAHIELMIQERRTKISEISRSAEISSKSADSHIAASEQAFTALQQTTKNLLENLVQAIEEKREATQKQARGLVQELQREISALTRRGAEVEQLSGGAQRPDFLQSSWALNATPPTRSWAGVGVDVPTYGGSVATAVTRLEETFRKEKETLVRKAQLRRVQQFEKEVTLDPDTAHGHLVLSDDGKHVHCGDATQNLPDGPERFNPAINVLGRQSFSSGRFYFEVQVRGKTSWDLGVARASANRKGSVSAKPESGFWTICLREGREHRAHDVRLSLKSQPEKVGVFVDYEKRSVSFYDVGAAELIHGFADCSFAEKLLPFFSPGRHHEGENRAPLVISPVQYDL